MSATVHANSKAWSDLDTDQSYRLTTEIVLEKNNFKVEIPLNANIRLQEKLSLPMIKVELLKFDVSKYCSDSNYTTDIALIDIKQQNGKVVTVGADIAEDCLLEVYVETGDSYSISFFK
jgi:hypothetical protein